MREANLAIRDRIQNHADEIVALYESGLNMDQIAGRFDVSSTPIRRILLHAGVRMRSGPEVISQTGMPKGTASKKWRGGRYVNRSGYVLIYKPDHPAVKPGGSPYVLEHRLVAEKRLGRYLLPTEHVHHRDGNRANNADDNLEVLSAAEHSSLHNPPQRVQKPCENCGAMVERCRAHFTDHVFCSQACRYAVLSPLIAQKRWAGKGREKRPIPCDHCGITMLRNPCQIKARNFCSVACRAEGLRGKPRGIPTTH